MVSVPDNIDNFLPYIPTDFGDVGILINLPISLADDRAQRETIASEIRSIYPAICVKVFATSPDDSYYVRVWDSGTGLHQQVRSDLMARVHGTPLLECLFLLAMEMEA